LRPAQRNVSVPNTIGLETTLFFSILIATRLFILRFDASILVNNALSLRTVFSVVDIARNWYTLVQAGVKRRVKNTVIRRARAALIRTEAIAVAFHRCTLLVA